jgi:hypothetical protein
MSLTKHTLELITTIPIYLVNALLSRVYSQRKFSFDKNKFDITKRHSKFIG